jgi:receptor protein-tyrosine kinase/non-specific protein-tyrosine kinase
MSKLEEALEKANTIRESMGKQVTSKAVSVNKDVLKRVNNEYIVMINQNDSPVAEEYRRLKSMVIRQTKADFLNTIMITSAVESEGKTLTSINLAIALAQEIDHSILLIDADLRKPMIHEYLGITYKYGLSDYLTRNIDISEVLIKTGIGNLVLLPAGSSVSNPVELLSSVRMKALVREIKNRYMDRYIILDTPPILPVADALTIGSIVDGVIFVIQEGNAKRTTIQEAMNRTKDLNVLGVVYNNVTETNLDGHYSHYYRYGYKNKEKQ